MKTSILFLALVCSSLLTACATQAELSDPDKLMAADPTAAGQPLTRQQVIAELERARRAGDMDYANSEASLYAPHNR